MNKSFKQFQLFILLISFWIILNNEADLKILIYGSVFCVVITLLFYNVMFEFSEETLRLPPLWRFIWFCSIVFIDIIKSATIHVSRIIKNESRYEVFVVTLETNNLVIITLIANAITLTPGTITMNVEGRSLEIIGFSKNQSDIEEMRKNILTYQKPFLYRRKG